ncbi:kelch-like protein 24 [Mercenaria mercenaria]|uniref:kelch-like protein 24 n=1 Tax=Mercenaria mercenaria TaxID=6596 RepID=UPI00234F446D|nr:kelch-like protein 24 [Mercenaria mercenaria]
MTSGEEPSTCWLQDGLRLLYEDRKHCDVKIRVQKEVFPCHKVVLSAASKYFDAMFSSGMKEAKADSANIEDVDPSTFNDVLAFIYNHENVITTHNVEELLFSACRFQILPLKEKCVNFLLEQLSPDNSVGFWAIGRSLTCEKLADTSLEFILDNFDDIVRSDELMRLDNQDFLNLISDENLKVQNEENVCRAALRWVDADGNSRREFMPKILSEMRLCQVSLDFILEELFTNQYVYQNENCSPILKNAIKYHAMPESRHMFQTMKVRLRSVSDRIALTWVLGKRTSSCGDYITEFIGHSEKDNSWYSLCTAPIELDEDFAACPLGDDLFVSGGTSKPNCLYQFSAKLCKWIEKPQMSQGRYRHAMVAVNKTLYVLGGNNFGAIGSVEVYDLLTNTWNNAGELKHAVDAASVAVYGEKIYIFGGWQGFSEESSEIQCFDTTTNTCTIVGNLPSPQKETRAVTFENKTYITCTNGDVYCFQPESGIKLVNRVKDFNKRNFGMFKDNTSLYLLGGELIDNIGTLSGDAERSSTQIIRLSSHVSSSRFPEQLPVAMEVYNCYRTVVKVQYPLVSFSEQLEFM